MNLTIQEAARLMKKTPQFIRIGMQRGILPIGTAIKNPGGKYSYYISPKLFEDYTGIKLQQKREGTVQSSSLMDDYSTLEKINQSGGHNE